ncbi:MAG: hypothetical protein WD885_01960 [Candidatus Saccharimonadales bacterium]
MRLSRSQSGAVSIVVISLIISCVLLVATIGFSTWAFTERQSYKNDVDGKIAAAIEINTKQVSDQKDNEFLEKEKFPLDTFEGSSQYGGVKVSYPKTWSAYIVENQATAEYVFAPDFISGEPDASRPLKITVETRSYSDALRVYDAQLLSGQLKAKAYSLPKVRNVVGTRFDGSVLEGKQGTVILLPLRDKTITISNEVPGLINDFNKIILENMSFNP